MVPKSLQLFVGTFQWGLESRKLALLLQHWDGIQKISVVSQNFNYASFLMTRLLKWLTYRKMLRQQWNIIVSEAQVLSSLNGTGHRVKQQSWVSLKPSQICKHGFPPSPVLGGSYTLLPARGFGGTGEVFLQFSCFNVLFLIDLQLCLLPLFFPL